MSQVRVLLNPILFFLYYAVGFDMNGESRKPGEMSIDLVRFSNLHEILQPVFSSDLSEKDRLEAAHKALLAAIRSFPSPCFLLGAVCEFIEALNNRFGPGFYSLSKFEFRLSRFSELSEEEKYAVRAKIAGRYIPREEYQILFPIGMGKRYPGSHYVTAHGSPDLDTTVASFWGWLDAFSASVSTLRHIWNVPGGAPESVEIDLLFYRVFGKDCFRSLAKTGNALSLSASDMISSDSPVYKNIEDTSQMMDDDTSGPVILVDKKGYYVGDWRREDKEGVRKTTGLLYHCIDWFSFLFHRKLHELLSSEEVRRSDFELLLSKLFALTFAETDPVREFTPKRFDRFDRYLQKVIGLEKGIHTSFGDFWERIETLLSDRSCRFPSIFRSSDFFDLFDNSGSLSSDRRVIFRHLEAIGTALEESVKNFRLYAERIGVAFSVKKEVFGYPSNTVHDGDDPDIIREKAGSLPYITVLGFDSESRPYPLGIVRSSEMHKPILGTVSLRDFCNREETKIPSYLEIVSIIDHHKSVLHTGSAPVARIGDAQSANTLVAEIAFLLNDVSGTAGFSEELLQERLRFLSSNQGNDPSSVRIIQKLLRKKQIISGNLPYFTDPKREFLEYIQYLYAILDDTDLLSKVSYRDVLCAASLLNRLKTLTIGKETETVRFDDIPQGEGFVEKAVRRLLQNEDMYSLYKKVYVLKEEAVELALRLSAEGKSLSLFADTKVQNGCSRVGQSKLFAKNFPVYRLHRKDIILLWAAGAERFSKERPECDLHMHMISTVPGADEMHSGGDLRFSHQDELWIWIPETEEGASHLQSFLEAFRRSTPIANAEMEGEFHGESAKRHQAIFRESFKPIRTIADSEETIPAPVIILRYEAGLLNSRKAMISPYLPKVMK